jgi:rubrerythrin
MEDVSASIKRLDELKEIAVRILATYPRNKTEQREILKKLNLDKKELTVQKKIINENIRNIKTKARQDRAAWTGARGKGLVGSIARMDRDNITRSKESALTPYEQQKTAVEARLITVEIEINRISKIYEDEKIEDEIIDNSREIELRCKYCGRLLDYEDNICPGCGATK